MRRRADEWAKMGAHPRRRRLLKKGSHHVHDPVTSPRGPPSAAPTSAGTPGTPPRQRAHVASPPPHRSLRRNRRRPAATAPRAPTTGATHTRPGWRVAWRPEAAWFLPPYRVHPRNALTKWVGGCHRRAAARAAKAAAAATAEAGAAAAAAVGGDSGRQTALARGWRRLVARRRVRRATLHAGRCGGKSPSADCRRKRERGGRGRGGATGATMTTHGPVGPPSSPLTVLGRWWLARKEQYLPGCIVHAPASCCTAVPAGDGGAAVSGLSILGRWLPRGSGPPPNPLVNEEGARGDASNGMHRCSLPLFGNAAHDMDDRNSSKRYDRSEKRQALHPSPSPDAYE